MRWFYFLPVAVLVAYAAYLGWQRGQLPSETEIINRYAALYLEMAPEGAALTDCAAAPHPNAGVRMVITCSHASGLVTTYFVGPRGEALPEPQGPTA
ncbi:hypothetical protein [Yoonia litorea]|uniref:Uncharacterized protein n=1 Tax=Yoonia litorea TaxID=1123755 RepID=A0A1I6LSR9_9RHOB|nr:hypothetical protein [Yoonia litorea]SFS06537.1 hypothetical protein SAMN05444714_0863 [Yoonia litorea]